MKIYNYNPENGYFIGESFADESPLETGVYLIPAHATEIPAPKATKDKVVVWNGNDWQLQDIPKPPIIDNSEFEAKQAARIAVAERLGLTADEIKLLIG